MSTSDRLHSLDAVRGFALLLGVLFHAGLSFVPGMVPGLWAIVDSSPSTSLSVVLFTSHIFRMTLFFFIAGFFARLAFHRKGPRGFWADRAKRIAVPLVVGWIVLFPAIAAVWVWGMKKSFGDAAADAPSMPAPTPGAFPLTHLWFLYTLLLLYVMVVALRAAVVAIDGKGTIRSGVDALVRRLAKSGTAALVLPLPLVAALVAREDWVVWFGIPTPDQSLVPQLASTVGYGTAVAFGWMIHRQSDLLATWRRQWPFHFAVALVATAVCLAIGGLTPTLVPAEPGPETLAFALSYGIAIWSWCFSILGLALRFAAKANRTVRYLADASYWIYLVHLPLVVALQVALGTLPWHWTVKLPLILTASLAVLLASYHFMVRSTFIGQVLNGRRHRRRHAPAPAAPTAAEDHTSPVMARLEGVHKHYGKTVALAGLDLELRRGELLAVLGPNGAGKSTALGLWLGLAEPDAGMATLLGGSPLEIGTRRSLGVMMQDVDLPPELRVHQLIALASSYYPNPLPLAETLARTRLEALADRPYGKLSGGQKRQVQFALAICGRPTVLFLDEPTVGLDIEARETLWRTVRALLADGCSIVLTTHYLEEAEALADRVAVLAAGRLVACDTVARIRALVSRKEIRCASALSVDDVGAWAGVVDATSDGARLRITVVDAEDVLRRLLASDAEVRDVEVRQAGLAEAFGELTKEAA